MPLAIAMLIISVINMLFFVASKKKKWDILQQSTFECGFVSYFFSRFSFSIHYFSIALIFLVLDLELCFIMPYGMEFSSTMKMDTNVMMFITILILGLVLEWKEGKLMWMF